MLVAAFLGIAITQAVPPLPRAPAMGLVITPERVVSGPGPVLRATSLIGAPQLPAGGVTVSFQCLVGRYGFLESCVGGGSEWLPFAERRLRGYRINVGDLELDRLGKAPVILMMRLVPSDQVDLAITGAVDPDSSNVTFVQRPADSVQGSFYPARGIRLVVQPTISVVCRVLRDYSLLCPEGQSDGGMPDEPAERAILEPGFLFAAQQVTGQFRVAPTLKDGRPSIGHQFRMRIVFRLSPD